MKKFLRTILALVLFSAGLRADEVYSTISGTPTNSVNYITYEVGGNFINQSGADVVMTKLGRWKKSGNSQVHTLTVYSSGGSVLGSTTVDMSGPEPAGAFVYGNLSPALTIVPSQSIYILSSETGGSESFWAFQGLTNTVPFGSIYIGTRQSGVLSSQYPNLATQTFGPVTFQYSAPIANYSYDSGTHTYTTDGTFFSVNSALRVAVSGDTVNIGAGTFTYFQGGATMTIPPGVTLAGDSEATTIINMATTAVTGYSSASITLSEGAVLKNLTINGPNALNCIPLQTTTYAGTWRVTEVTYNQYTGRDSYFILINRAPSGRIDNCNIVGGAGSSELILARGPDTAWQNPSGIGDENAVYVESNTFSGVGYVCDGNDNAKLVVRFNTINGQNKIDGHGRASNSTRGVRRIEAYCNTFTAGPGSWYAFELRGGKNMIFNNTAATGASGAAQMILRDYGYIGMASGFQYRFQTPNNYPLLDQVGTSQDVTVNATTISAGDFVKIATVGTTDFTAFGATSNTPGQWFFATATPTGSGTVTTNGPTDPAYIFGNVRGGGTWARTTPPLPTNSTGNTNTAGYAIGATSITMSSINTDTYANNAIAFAGDTNRYRITNTNLAGSNRTITIAAPGLLDDIPTSATAGTVLALTQYQFQQGSSSATFGDTDIIQSNRDLYADAGFDTNTGVTVGTAAQMAATSAAGKNLQGFWVTNEGSWNTENGTPGTPGYQKGNGQLYVSNGTNWVLTYTPQTYPLSSSAPETPVLTAGSIGSAGNSLSLTFSISCTTGAGGNGGVTLTASGGAVTPTYTTGTGSDTYSYSLSRTIVSGEVVTVSYTQPGNGIESTSDQVDLASFTGQPVTNNSAVNDGQAPSLRNQAGLGAGF